MLTLRLRFRPEGRRSTTDQYSGFPALQQRKSDVHTVEVSIPGARVPDRVHVDIRGSDGDRSVILLHGWGSSSELMAPLATRLENDFRVISVDFPGHGRSPVPHTPWDIPAHALLVEHLLERYGSEHTIIVGHSNGGRVALHMMAQSDAPATVRALVLVAPSGIRRRRTVGFYVRSWTARILKAPFALMPGPVRNFGLDWLRHSLVWKLLSSSDYQTLEGVMRETFVQCVNHYVEDVLSRISVPVVVLRGDADDAISDNQVQRLVAGLDDAGLVTLPGAGHYAHLDAPDAVTAAVHEVSP